MKLSTLIRANNFISAANGHAGFHCFGHKMSPVRSNFLFVLCVLKPDAVRAFVFVFSLDK